MTKGNELVVAIPVFVLDGVIAALKAEPLQTARIVGAMMALEDHRRRGRHMGSRDADIVDTRPAEAGWMK